MLLAVSHHAIVPLLDMLWLNDPVVKFICPAWRFSRDWAALVELKFFLCGQNTSIFQQALDKIIWVLE
jgi:hypothetical protein